VKLTGLSSRNNSLVSYYDVSGDKDGLLRSHALPYSLSGLFPDGPHAGFYVAQPHSDSGNDTTASLLRLTSHGGVYQTALAFCQDTDTTPLSVAVDVSWSSEIHRLATASSIQRPDVGRLGARAMEEADFCRVYQRRLSLASGSSFRVIQNLAKLFRTLLPARRHRVLLGFIPVISGDVQSIAERICKYDLVLHDYRSGSSLRRGSEAREQLAVDLVLSCIQRSHLRGKRER